MHARISHAAVEKLDEEALKLWNMVMGCFAREKGIINSQNVIIALLMRLRFTKMEKKDELLKLIDTKKHGVVLDLIGNFLDLKKNPPLQYRDRVLEIFQETARAWILAHLPDAIELELVFSDTSSATVPFEHPLHVCMSYYCNSQGILYEKKGDLIRCEVHESHRIRVSENKPDESDKDSMEMRMARVYAESEYDALLVLCANRVYRDALYGNKRGECAESSNADDRQRQAEDLLSVARKNHQLVVDAQVDAKSKTTNVTHSDQSANEGKTISEDTSKSSVLASESGSAPGIPMPELKNKKKVPALNLCIDDASSRPEVPPAPNAQKKSSNQLHFPIS